MGSSLSTAEPATPARPAQGPGSLVWPQPLPRGQGTGAPPRRAIPQARWHFEAKQPLETVLGQDLSRPQEWDRKRWHARPRWPPGAWTPVTVEMAPPEGRGRPCAPQGLTPAQEHPDPCAKEAVLGALQGCQKGGGKFDTLLWFEVAEPRPSAFKPLTKNAEGASFAPRPGPLNRSLCSWSDSVCEARAS